MKNLMAKSMIERYENYLSTNDLVDRIAKSIFYWTMSTLESVFWSLQSKTCFVANLYANEQKIFLNFHILGEEYYEFIYYLPYDCSNGKLNQILQRFIEIFNNIEYPISKKISLPVFNACYYDKVLKDSKYKGYYHINICIDMLI